MYDLLLGLRAACVQAIALVFGGDTCSDTWFVVLWSGMLIADHC